MEKVNRDFLLYVIRVSLWIVKVWDINLNFLCGEV